MFFKDTLGLSSLTKKASNRHKYYIRLLQSREPVMALAPGFGIPGYSYSTAFAVEASNYIPYLLDF